MTMVFAAPALMVGFDIESTGLDTQSDEPISYGFAEFVHGELIRTDEFFVLPTVEIHPGAERVHGISMETLRRLRREGIALSTLAGAIRATSRLLQYRSMGAIFVGSNPMFDYRMLDSTLRRHASLGLEGHGFDMATMSLIDVVRHDRMIDSDFKSRPRRGLHLLCEHYHVEPGCHRAAQDARAAGEVLLRQSAMLNQKLRDVAQDSEEVSA